MADAVAAIQVAIRVGVDVPKSSIRDDAALICEELRLTSPDDETSEIFSRALEHLTHDAS